MAAKKLISKTIWNSNLRLFLLVIISMAIFGAVVYLRYLPYWMAQLGEAKPISAEEIINFEGNAYYNRQIEGLNMEDTFYYEENVDSRTGLGMGINAYFGALEIADGVWILVKQAEEINERQLLYVGAIVPIPDDLHRQTIALASEEMGIEFLPVILTTMDTQMVWQAETAVVALLGSLALLASLILIWRLIMPNSHPILRGLKAYGKADEVAKDIEKNLENGVQKVGKIYLTDSWIIHKSSASLKAMPLDAVVWAYKLVENGRYGTDYKACFYDKVGNSMQLKDWEDSVDDMIYAVSNRVPWAIYGYSLELKLRWQRDRQRFLNDVEARKTS